MASFILKSNISAKWFFWTSVNLILFVQFFIFHILINGKVLLQNYQIYMKINSDE